MNELLQDRVPPQNIEAEQAVLGSIFLDADVLIEAMEYVEPKDFYRRSHQLIFQTMMTLSDRNEAIDVVTIKDRLEQENLLEDVGGLSYLSDLALAVPTSLPMSFIMQKLLNKIVAAQLNPNRYRDCN